MKILVISQVYYPDTASTAQHLSDLLEALSKKGHEVTVFTSIRKYETPSIKFSNRETVNGVKIVRLLNTGFGKKNKLSRVCDFLSFNILILLKLLFIKRKKFDVMLGMTSPPLLSYIGILMAKRKKIKFAYWTMDLQPELSIIAGYFNPDSYSAKSLQRKGDYIFKNANRIIALDSYMKDHIESRTHQKMDNIDVIPVWPVMGKEYIGKRSDNPFRIENKFGDKIVIMYSGNHSIMHPLKAMLEAAVQLKDDERFLFVHIGGGERLKDVQSYKDTHALSNIVMLPYQDRAFIHISLGSSDIQVVSLGEKCVGYTHPNKIYGAMYIGKPILYIGPSKSHITDILKECPGNISVGHDESRALVKHLLKFTELSESERNSIGERNREFAQEHFTPTILINDMVDSIEKA